MHELINPNPPLYFICYNFDEGGNKRPESHGLVLSDQAMQSGLDNIEIFSNEEEFRAKLLEYGIEDTEYQPQACTSYENPTFIEE